MKNVIRVLSSVLCVVLLLFNIMVSAEEKNPTVIVGNANIAEGEIGMIFITTENFDNFLGGFNFEIKFPEIVEIKDVYYNEEKLVSLSNGGSDYNVKDDNVLIFADTCNYGAGTRLDDNNAYYVEFELKNSAKNGEYPVIFTDDTYIIDDANDEELIFPVMVDGKITVTDQNGIKADINENGKADATDLTVLRKKLIGLDYGEVFNKTSADVNADSEVDLKDLVSIKKYLSIPAKNLPDTGGVIETVIGGAEKEAKIYRDNINNAQDTLTVTGKKYYVSQNGNDSNTGTSPEKPFKTLEKISGKYSSLRAGDAVYFERGSIFRTSGAFGLYLKEGVSYGAYGQGEKPKIYASARNYADKTLWTQSDIPNVWKMSFETSIDKNDIGIIVLDGGKEVGKKQMYLSELTVNDDFYHDWDTNILYFYCDKGNPGQVFNDIEIGAKTEIFHFVSNAKDIKIDNISFSYSGTFAIRSPGGVKNVSITNCAFSWIGGSLFENKTNRFGNAIEFAAGCEDIVVKNCSFDQIFDSGVTFQVGDSAFRNFTVEDCLFEYNGMSGFEWWTDGDIGDEDGIPIDATVIENISIKNNLFRLTGFGWSKATRSPTHIRNGWKNKLYPNMKNFTISNNIFDFVNGQIIASGWRNTPEEYKILNNTYYQRAVIMQDLGGKYQPFTPIDNQNVYATDFSEFIGAVRSIDESAERIVWIPVL